MCIFAASNKLIYLYRYAPSIINQKHKEMNHLPNFQNATFESFWASLQETKLVLREKTAEGDRQMQELREQMKKTDLQIMTIKFISVLPLCNCLPRHSTAKCRNLKQVRDTSSLLIMKQKP